MEKIFTDDKIDSVPYIGKLSEKGLREFARDIEQAALNSEQVQAWKRDAIRNRCRNGE